MVEQVASPEPLIGCALQPEIVFAPSLNWTVPVFETLGLREYRPWFMWALRNVTAKTGYYKFRSPNGKDALIRADEILMMNEQ